MHCPDMRQGKHVKVNELPLGAGRVYWHGRLVPNTRVAELPFLTDRFVHQKLLEEAERGAGGRQRQNAQEIKARLPPTLLVARPGRLPEHASYAMRTVSCCSIASCMVAMDDRKKRQRSWRCYNPVATAL